jgi:hypothetical protein
METLQIRKEDFSKILDTAGELLAEVEKALSQDELVKQRVTDIREGKVKGKSEKELEEYLRKRGLKIG